MLADGPAAVEPGPPEVVPHHEGVDGVDIPRVHGLEVGLHDLFGARADRRHRNVLARDRSTSATATATSRSRTTSAPENQRARNCRPATGASASAFRDSPSRTMPAVWQPTSQPASVSRLRRRMLGQTQTRLRSGRVCVGRSPQRRRRRTPVPANQIASPAWNGNSTVCAVLPVETTKGRRHGVPESADDRDDGEDPAPAGCGRRGPRAPPPARPRSRPRAWRPSGAPGGGRAPASRGGAPARAPPGRPAGAGPARPRRAPRARRPPAASVVRRARRRACARPRRRRAAHRTDPTSAMVWEAYQVGLSNIESRCCVDGLAVAVRVELAAEGEQQAAGHEQARR